MVEDEAVSYSTLCDIVGAFHCESLSASFSIGLAEYQKHVFGGRNIGPITTAMDESVRDKPSLYSNLTYVHELDHYKWFATTPFGAYIWKLLYGLTDCVTFVLQRLAYAGIRMSVRQPLAKWVSEHAIPAIEREVNSYGLKIAGELDSILELREFLFHIDNYCSLLRLFLSPRPTQLTLGELCAAMNDVIALNNQIFRHQGKFCGSEVYTDLSEDSPAIPQHPAFLNSFDLLEGHARLVEYEYLKFRYDEKVIDEWKSRKLRYPYDVAYDRFYNYCRVLFPAIEDKVFSDNLLMYWSFMSSLEDTMSLGEPRRLEDILPWFRSAKLYLMSNPGERDALPAGLRNWNFETSVHDMLLAKHLRKWPPAVAGKIFPRRFVRSLGVGERLMLERMKKIYSRNICFRYNYLFSEGFSERLSEKRRDEASRRVLGGSMYVPGVIFLSDRMLSYWSGSEAKVGIFALLFWFATTEMTFCILEGRPSKRLLPQIKLFEQWAQGATAGWFWRFVVGKSEIELNRLFLRDRVVGMLNEKFGGAADLFLELR